MGKYSARQQQMGIQRILSRVSEAYGRMMLYEGLFQADGHPGNILVMKGDDLYCVWQQATTTSFIARVDSQVDLRYWIGWHQNRVCTSCSEQASLLIRTDTIL